MSVTSSGSQNNPSKFYQHEVRCHAQILTARRYVTDDRTHQCTIYAAYNTSNKCNGVRKILSSILNKTSQSDLDVTSPG
jgi:hypothetical protein